MLGLAECIVCWSQSEDFAIVLRATENVPFAGCCSYQRTGGCCSYLVVIRVSPRCFSSQFSTSDDLPGQLNCWLVVSVFIAHSPARTMLLLPPPRTIWLNGVLRVIAGSLFQCLQLTVLQLARFTSCVSLMLKRGSNASQPTSKIQEIAQIWNECLVVAALNMKIRLVRGDCCFINAKTYHIRVCLNAFILRLHMFARKQMPVLKFAYFLNQVGHMMYCGLVL